ncbi:SRPBCC family protein [Actinomadura keratinilytica]|uniref:Coenzyme Q-binding protein COQ10 START domain-containing protein n=1 Tax=Actinomadura keratinilytica TaxID=547461 RepID=A0ABP7YV00_9ACTN
MKLPKRTSRLLLGRLAKRLPVGGKQSPVDRVTDILTAGGSKIPIPVNRTTGAAGGALLGVAASVAAARLIGRMQREKEGGAAGAAGSAAKSAVSTAKSAVSSATQEAPAETGQAAGGEQAAGSEQGAGGERKERKGLLDKVTGRGGRGGGKKIKVTNIVEQIDIGAPRRMVYDQWTQFEDFPSFMKKVISVNQESDEKLTWTAQIFWSTRSWESTITQQTPDEHIAWQSKGAKGHVDGSVTFHELAPDMTRVLVDLEYHPKGFFEKTANLWRAQGRRTRLELKHFRRHLTNHVLTHPEELHGWRGQIRDSEVVVSHEEAVGEKGGEKKEAAREEPRRERAEERAERREHEKV